MHQGCYGRDLTPAATPFRGRAIASRTQGDTMSIGIVGAGNMGASIATQFARTGEPVTLTDRNLGKAESVVAGIAGDGVSAADVSATLASDVVVLALWYPGTADFAAEHAAE